METEIFSIFNMFKSQKEEREFSKAEFQTWESFLCDVSWAQFAYIIYQYLNTSKTNANF